MPIRFPENKEGYTGVPWVDTNGLKWIYNPERQRWARYDDLQRATYVQATEPTSAENGQFWYDTANELLKLWDGATWVEAGGGGGASAWNDLTGTADSVPFTITAPNGAPTKGVLAWDGAEETLSLGLAHDSVLQLGQETLYHVQNASTTIPIADGTPVMYSGTVGNSGRMYVTPWSGNVADVKKFMGLATGPIPPRSTDADTGYVTHFGKVRGIKTNGDGLGETWNNGQILYLKKGAGGLTNVAPTAPGPRTIAALVLSAHSNNGTLFVRVTHGSNLGDDELVQLSGLADKHALLYDGATSRFVNRAIVSADVSDATASPDGSKIVLRDATGGASFAEQINIIGLVNTVVVQGAALTFSNSTNENVLAVTVPFAPTADRTITFPDASGTVSLVGHTHTSADITDATAVATPSTIVKRDTYGGAAFLTVSSENFTTTGSGGTHTLTGTTTITGVTSITGGASDTFTVSGVQAIALSGTSQITYNGGSGSALQFTSTTAARTYRTPDATGTLALTNRTDGVPDNIIPNNAATTRTNLGLGTTDFVTFSRLELTADTGVNSIICGPVNYRKFAVYHDSGQSCQVKIPSLGSINWTSGYADSASDLSLFRDAADTLAQRRGTNAQTFRLYRTYTSASSYQRLTLSTTTDAFNFTAESTSTSNLDLNLLPQGTGKTKTTNLDATGDITASGGAGEVDINSLYGSGLQFRSVEVVVNTNTTTATAATGTIIPAGALVLGVVVRVTTAVAGPTASFKVGIASVDDDKWGNAVPIGVNSTTTSANFTDGAPMFFSSATAVTLTANDNTFTSGAVRVCVHYLQISQLTA